MEIKPVGNLLTASALRARSRAVELSKKRKNVSGQATQGAEFFVIFLAIHHCCVYLCDSVLCEIVKEISRIIRMVIISLRKHTFLLALRRWGRFARRNVSDSATEIPY